MNCKHSERISLCFYILFSSFGDSRKKGFLRIFDNSGTFNDELPRILCDIPSRAGETLLLGLISF